MLVFVIFTNVVFLSSFYPMVFLFVNIHIGADKICLCNFQFRKYLFGKRNKATNYPKTGNSRNLLVLRKNDKKQQKTEIGT